MARLSDPAMFRLFELILAEQFPTLDVSEIKEILSAIKGGTITRKAIDSVMDFEVDDLPDHNALTSQLEQLIDELMGADDKSLETMASKSKKAHKQREKEAADTFDREISQFHISDEAYQHFARLAYWEKHEAISLLLGVDPRLIKAREIEKSPKASKFRQDYIRNDQYIERALLAESLKSISESDEGDGEKKLVASD